MEKLNVTPEQRGSKIKIGGREYDMLLTTGAVLAIAQKYGKVEAVATEIQNSDIGTQVGTVIWLIALMVNQGIKRNNLLNHTQEPLLSEEDIGVLMDIRDLAQFKGVLFDTMTDGFQMNVESEYDGESKNPDA